MDDKKFEERTKQLHSEMVEKASGWRDIPLTIFMYTTSDEEVHLMVDDVAHVLALPPTSMLDNLKGMIKDDPAIHGVLVIVIATGPERPENMSEEEKERAAEQGKRLIAGDTSVLDELCKRETLIFVAESRTGYSRYYIHDFKRAEDGTVTLGPDEGSSDLVPGGGCLAGFFK
jgi:hypothetical protein